MNEPRAHELKVWPMYFGDVLAGRKTFEYRKDDRQPRYETGDVLHLREWGKGTGYTGRDCYREVSYVARGYLIPEGFCILSIVECGAPSSGEELEVEVAALRAGASQGAERT